MKEAPPTRARGVIALLEENCTVCMLCARSCPDWCIYIEGHKYKAPPRREGGKARTVSALDRFDIDYALCMYCGICVEVCPFDALFWTPEYEYSEPAHRRPAPRQGRARRVDGTGPDYEPYEAGSEEKVRKVPTLTMVLAETMVAQNIAFGVIAAVVVVGGAPGRHDEQRRARRALPRVGARRRRRSFLLLGAEFVGITQILVYIGAIVVLFLFGIMLTRAPIGRTLELTEPALVASSRRRACVAGVLAYASSTPSGTGSSRKESAADHRQVSDSIFAPYLVPFEVVSVLLLAALVGAIVLAREE